MIDRLRPSEFALISFVVSGILIGALFHLEKLHRLQREDPLPRPRLSDYPRLERHCQECQQCRKRFQLIDRGELSWDSHPFCEQGFDLLGLDFQEAWEKAN